MTARLPTAAVAVAVVVAIVALASAAHSARGVWHGMSAERSRDARLDAAARRRAPIEQIDVPGAVFDFYAEFTVPGDRVFFQVRPGNGRPAAFAAAGRYYLLPALETSRLSDATVVLTYGENPSRLGVRFVTQRRLGTGQVYVSRIGVP